MGFSEVGVERAFTFHQAIKFLDASLNCCFNLVNIDLSKWRSTYLA
jgi:hypothetical protein